MRLLRTFLLDERAELVARGIRLTTIGDEARLPRVRARAAGGVKQRRAPESGDDAVPGALLRRARGDRRRRASAGGGRGARRLPPDVIDEASFAGALDTRDLPPLDLFIRTSGERRLSNFLLWESAYAELYFTDVMWPDFARADLEAALADFAAAATSLWTAGSISGVTPSGVRRDPMLQGGSRTVIAVT